LARSEKIVSTTFASAEQHRIVAKADELLAVCDELEARLTTATNTRRALLEATLQEALASGEY
jgi:type I restriction enzyme S subunit